MSKLLTLCIIHQGNRVLLGMKKRGFGLGRWNGFGGKVEKGETTEEAIRREVFEEASIDVTDARKVGIIEFEFQGDPQILEVHIFRAEKFVGEPTEGEEMKPQWFAVKDIPLEKMWPDDKYWIPMFLEGKSFTGKFLFGKGDIVEEHALEEVESLG
jgi:8-oxo-dGTP diphosphatase/2-hydroxy-dATP diphosphatase